MYTAGLPTLDQKLFLVISVALATVSFFINVIQIVIFIYHDLLHNVRNMLLLSQAVSGLIATFTIVYPIKLVTAYPVPPHLLHHHNFFNDFSVCYFLASGFLLLSMFSAVSNFTVLVLEQYLNLVHPPLAARFQTDYIFATACVTVAWVESVLVALAPWLGWNAWRDDEECRLPDAWPVAFTAFVTLLFFAHAGVALALFVRIWLAVRRRSYTVNPDSEELPVTSASSVSMSSAENVPLVTTAEAKLHCITFAVLLACHAPLVLHLASHSECVSDAHCQGPPVSDRTTTFIWTSLLLVVNSVVAPLLYIFTDDHLTKATIWFLKLCCCPNWCSGSNAVSPLPQ